MVGVVSGWALAVSKPTSQEEDLERDHNLFFFFFFFLLLMQNEKASHIYDISVHSQLPKLCVHDARQCFSGMRTAVIGSEGRR